MDKVFEFIINSRKAFIQLMDGLTTEQLNIIPDGYSNNIIWNFGHIVVSTQTLCYVRTDILPDTATVKFVDAYKKGSKPTYTVTGQEVAELKKIALDSIAQIEKDYHKGVFANITSFATSTFHVEMQSIEEILITSIGHDNVHYGYAWALKRAIFSNKIK